MLTDKQDGEKMDFIFNVLGNIGGTIASFYADHSLAAAIVTVVAIGIFWWLMGWEKSPDFSDRSQVAKNGLIVLVGWAITVPVLDFVFSIISKLLEWAGIAGGGIFWVWERFNEQPFVVLACLFIAIFGGWIWHYRSKSQHALLKAAGSFLVFLVMVGISVPIANNLTKEESNTPIVSTTQAE